MGDLGVPHGGAAARGARRKGAAAPFLFLVLPSVPVVSPPSTRGLRSGAREALDRGGHEEPLWVEAFHGRPAFQGRARAVAGAVLEG